MAVPVTSGWNQPRCWSEPSRYRSAGLRGSSRRSSTLTHHTESNHTSRVSVTFSYIGLIAQQLGWIQLEPGVDTRLLHAQGDLLDQRLGIRCSSPLSRWTGTGRWARSRCAGARYTSQGTGNHSVIRASAPSGCHVTGYLGERPSSRPFWLMLTNHCGWREMIGVLWRQQWG